MVFQTPVSDNAPRTRRRKAAIVVQMLIADGSALALHALPQEMQLLLTQELGNLRRVDKETLAAVAEEFAAELSAVGLAQSGGRDGAIDALADHLSPALAADLRRQTARVRDGDHWPVIADLSVGRIVAIMQAESITICAVTLSKLPVSKAAEVLTQIAGEHARRIIYAMSQTAAGSPDTVRRIGASLADTYGHPPAHAFEKAPVQRLGAILNSTRSDTREDVLAGLGTADPVFASDVRKAIFTFKDIAHRVKANDVTNCIRNVDPAALTTAIAAALSAAPPEAASAEFILENLSQRLAGQLRDDADEMGPIKPAEAEEAMAEITKSIRDMVDRGAITLRDPDEPADAAAN